MEGKFLLVQPTVISGAKMTITGDLGLNILKTRPSKQLGQGRGGSWGLKTSNISPPRVSGSEMRGKVWMDILVQYAACTI